MKMRANQKRSSPHEVLLPTARGVASLVKYKTIIFFLSSWLKVKQLYFAWAGSAIKYKTIIFMKIWPGGKKKRKKPINNIEQITLIPKATYRNNKHPEDTPFF